MTPNYYTSQSLLDNPKSNMFNAQNSPGNSPGNSGNVSRDFVPGTSSTFWNAYQKSLQELQQKQMVLGGQSEVKRPSGALDLTNSKW